jgi:glycosyltransferase involved in cell wall biosynthesis
MSERQPTIWINVTTSANWHRSAVGIVRVERELRDNLRKLYPVGQFKECIWTGDGFSVFAAGAGEAKAGSNIEVLELPAALPVSYLFPVLPKRQAVIAIAQGAMSLVPDRLRPALDRLMRRCKAPVVQAMNYLAVRRYRKQAKIVASEPHTMGSKADKDLVFSHPFQAGDVLISVGLDWSWTFYKDFYYLRTREKVKIVTCCYDLIPVLYPQYCVGEVASMFTSYFLDIAEGSDMVLCISKQSEQDLLEMLDRTGGRKVKTHVFPLGDNVPSGGGSVSSEVEDVASEPFILFVSSIERRKNHEVLYRAYHLLCQEGKRVQLPKLVFVGMPGWGVGDLLKDIELDPLTKGMIIQLNHVNDAELLKLYQSSLFCVFPSLYEGWGLPVGEAMSLGKAVLSSNRGSLPEVGGDLVCYVDPWSPRAWADEIYRMATDEVWRTEWEQKVKTQYQARTWADAVITVKNAIQSIESSGF